MEIHKDNSREKGLTTIPYNPDLFHNDRDFYLAYRKIEHIVAAIFLVTGLIENNDLIKDSIRNHSLQCLNEIVAMIGKQNTGAADLNQLASRVMHLSSLLDIAFWSGHVSQMNLTILQREIGATYQTLNDLSSKYKDTYYISAQFFKTDEQILNETQQKDIQSAVSETRSVPSFKGQTPITTSPVTPIISDPEKRQEEVKHIMEEVKQEVTKEAQEELASTSENKLDRREAILSLLRQRNNLSVKDFTSVVSEYSEKTIQRELLALVEEGVVKKEGERRWSTYSLAQSSTTV